MHKNSIACSRKRIIIFLSAIILFIPSGSHESGAWLADYLEQKAMCNYSQAMDILADRTLETREAHVIETNLFRIFELVKYPELIDKAVSSFDRISQNSIVKENLFLKSRIDLFLIPLLLKKGELKKARAVRDKLGTISDYKLLGPFINTNDKAFNNLTGEADYTSDDLQRLLKNGRWFESSTDLEGKLDIGELFDSVGDSVFFLKTVLPAADDGEYILMLGKTGHTDILINGDMVFSSKRSHGFSFDQYCLKLKLSKGRHDILIRTCASSEHGIKLALRFLEMNGKPAGYMDAGKQPENISRQDHIPMALSMFAALEHEINNDDPASAFNAGYLFYISKLNSEEFGESADYFNKAKERGLSGSASDYYLGLIAKNDSEKYYHFNESIKLFTGNIESLKEIISLKLKKNLVYEAYPLIYSIKKIDPRCRYFLKYKTLALFQLGWYIPALNECIRMKSAGMLSAAYGTEYRIHLKNKRYGEALNSCRDLYKLDRYDPNVLTNYIDCCFKTGKYADADSVLSQGIRLFPNSINLKLKYAELKEYTRNPRSALPFLLSSRRLSPDNKRVLLKTGLLYHKLNRDELAEQYMSAALKHYQGNGPDNEWIKRYLDFIRSEQKAGTNLIDNPAYINNQNLSDKEPESDTVVAQDKKDFKSIENEISESLFKGDQYTAFEKISKLLTVFPAEPASILYYTELIKYAPVVWHNRIERVFKTLIKSLESIEDFPAKNLYILTLKLELEKLLYRYKRKEAEYYSKAFYPVRKWSLMGPFSKYGYSDIDHEFPPEVIRDPEKAKIKMKVINIRNSEGCLNPAGYVYPVKGVIYAASAIKLNQPVRIRVYSCSEYKVFINGREIIRNLKSGIFRNCRIINIRDCDKITFMIKILMQNDKSCFRIIVTDFKDRVLKINAGYPDFVNTDFNFTEQMDYPFEHYNNMIAESDRTISNIRDADYRLARYFHRLGSMEAIEYYEGASITPDMLNSFYFAECLSELSCSEHTSAMYGRSCEITRKLIKRFPGIIPARHMKINELMAAGKYEEAFGISSVLIKEDPDYLPVRLDHARLLLRAGYEKEFEKKIEAAINRFPHSVCALSILADYYLVRNIPETARLYKEILLRERCEDSLMYLVNLYMELGEYSKIVELTKRCKGNYTKELIESLFYLKDYSSAKKAIFGALVKKDDPYYYIKLGQISYLNGSEPGMYWRKALFVDPSNFFINDLLKYLESGKLEHPFKEYINSSAMEMSRTNIPVSHDNNTSVVPGRSMVFLLNKDGGNRFFCTETVLVKGSNAVNKWKKIRVLFPGEIHPVAISVINNGLPDDLYTISYSNDVGMISLPSVRDGSVVHLVYYIDNPLTAMGCNFLSVPGISIYEPGERVDRFKLMVIADRGIKVFFSFNREVNIHSEVIQDNNIYNIELNKLSGDMPLYFSFSTIPEIRDFVMWYSGLMHGSLNQEPNIFKLQSTGQMTPEQTVKLVYNFVNNKIRHVDNALYSPGNPEDTLFNKAGSAEDKAILALAMLKESGINSYLAFTGNKFTGNSSFISPWIFENVLLYVPLSIGMGIWMDFSDPDIKYGQTDKRVRGKEALVIIKDGYEIKKISGH